MTCLSLSGCKAEANCVVRWNFVFSYPLCHHHAVDLAAIPTRYVGKGTVRPLTELSSDERRRVPVRMFPLNDSDYAHLRRAYATA